MSPLVLPLPGNEALAAKLGATIRGDVGELTVRRFPDGESYVRLRSSPQGRAVVVVASMDRPDPKFIPLLLVLETARELGARSVGLVSPYLCYMRQDRRFQEGEAISARVFPRLIARSLDWLVTVDPHLHRITDLSEVYPVPARVVHAAPVVAGWIAKEVRKPLLIGPDSESEQWVVDVARHAGAPFVILEKVRRGDRDVEISVPDVTRWREHTPVLVDDIISTGRTMVETLGHLRRAGMRAAVCIGVHGLFAPRALEELRAAGAATLVTCDSVTHATNEIDLSAALAAATVEMLRPAESA